MESMDPTSALLKRIWKLDPERCSRILGYLLFHNGPDELAELVALPEHYFQQVVLAVQAALAQLGPLSPLNRRMQPWDMHKLGGGCSDVLGPLADHPELRNPPQVLPGHDDSVESFYQGARPNRRLAGTEFPVKTCHYFNKGFCKHGSSCRYAHGQVVPENFVPLYGNNPVPGDEQVVSQALFEKTELEIVELLKSKRGSPVSIASLPSMYQQKYGKQIDANGYQSESQRHGKPGSNLTKLLVRLKNSIRLIDRPHGQHAVMLAEDAMEFMDNRSEKSDPGPIVSGSRQIYLTFPAESTFTEEDVSNYFDSFGPVEDVRIPCQQKRMFGFVTFVNAETVKIILSNGNPHFVCGARVLVKPYREKSKIMDRKFSDRPENMMLYQPSYSDMEAEFHALRNKRLLRKQYQEQQEQALALEDEFRRIQLAENPVNDQSFFNYSLNELTVPEDQLNLRNSDQFSHVYDALNCGSTSADANHNDQESLALNLPDSPFSSSTANGVSMVM